MKDRRKKKHTTHRGADGQEKKIKENRRGG
jgi:hypothetical protein